MNVRPPPPSGAPPAYSRMVKKVYPYNLRPVFLVTSLVGFIWSVVIGVEGIQDLSDWTNAKIKAIELVLAIMAFVVAGIEVSAFVIGCMSTILDQCVVSETGDSIDDVSVVSAKTRIRELLVAHETLLQNENGVTYSAAQALDGTIFSALKVLFTSVAMSYYRQLLDPSSVRQRVARFTEGAFQLQPQGPYAGNAAQGYQQPYGQPQYGYAPPEGPPGGYVPPYPGPPDANSPFAPRNDDDTKASTGEFSLEAQERAWRDATANGPTANVGYVPPAGPPPGQDAGAQRGYDVGHNEEEDEAWARAREGGVTAHLTGGNDTLRQGGGRV
ncbi:hypothetical protein QFC21_000022 [Naganishia friedmannii]|uniref:Uncharacterized protein n=1 Tax=Naganishia friedmannii TaxID=89922 RepID=A0ACC2WCA2_9TREE|nr:hypothetical protein QFC21_000022 [Naganishia friedmannii]